MTTPPRRDADRNDLVAVPDDGGSADARTRRSRRSPRRRIRRRCAEPRRFPPQPKSSFNSAMPVVLGFAVAAVVLAAAGLVWSKFQSRNAPSADAPAASISAPSAANPTTSAPASADATPRRACRGESSAGSRAAVRGAGRESGRCDDITTGAPTARGTTPPAGAPASAGADASGRAAAPRRGAILGTDDSASSRCQFHRRRPLRRRHRIRVRPTQVTRRSCFRTSRYLSSPAGAHRIADALLSFVGGQLTVLESTGRDHHRVNRRTKRSSGRPMFARAVRSGIRRLFSPPDNLDMPGILPTARHWLVLQSRSGLSDPAACREHVAQVLETIENRTGLKVDRSNSGGW